MCFERILYTLGAISSVNNLRLESTKFGELWVTYTTVNVQKCFCWNTLSACLMVSWWQSHFFFEFPEYPSRIQIFASWAGLRIRIRHFKKGWIRIRSEQKDPKSLYNRTIPSIFILKMFIGFLYGLGSDIENAGGEDRGSHKNCQIIHDQNTKCFHR